MILVCYDGSDNARAAIDRAAELFPGQTATVVTVWEPVTEILARASLGFGMVPSVSNAAEIDEANREAAEETAAKGAKLASDAGLQSESRAVTQITTPGRAILSCAEGLDPSAIVIGTRGLTGVKSLVLGSVSHEVVQHADRPVTVVPSPELAAARARALNQDGA